MDTSCCSTAPSIRRRRLARDGCARHSADLSRSTPWRPYHPHDEVPPLSPDEPVDLDVEIWPTSVVVPQGWAIALTILGRDYDHGQAAAGLSNMKNAMRGCGPFVHEGADDRPPAVFGGRNKLHFNPARPAHVLLPIVPSPIALA